VKNADAIQEAFKFIWPRPVLLMVSWPFHHSVSEVALGILRLFLLIGPFGRLENLICETLESVAIPGLVLSLGVKMQMQSRKPSNSPDLGLYSLWCRGRSTILIEWSAFLFLSWPLDELG
jgi:hypothetical protein